MSYHRIMKPVCLTVLSVQNVLHTMAMHKSRSDSRAPFLTSSVLILSEVVKFLISAFVLYKDNKLGRAFRLIIDAPLDFLQTCVPALIYVVQNGILFYALSNLDATVFQVTYQIKLLTTALFSFIFLGKKISVIQWISLVLLFVGVSVSQIHNQSGKSSGEKQPTTNSFGLLAVLFASLLSGFAACYFEKILKQSPKSLWNRNLELSMASIAIAVVGQILRDHEKVNTLGFFYGFDLLVWVIICLQSGGGLVVALVIKYADNILKGFACSVSIVLSCIISVAFLDLHLSGTFMLGAACVITSVMLYSAFPARQP